MKPSFAPTLWRLAAAAALLLPSSLPAQTASTPKQSLWSGLAPLGGGATEQGDAFVTFHPAPQPNGCSVVICPGGGYGGLVTGGEGHGIAAWLNKHGVAGIVLEYRLPKGRPYVPLLDAQRAIRTVRSKAGEWKLDPAKVGIAGFSAGGHLASTAGTHFDSGKPDAKDPVERFGSRPDFMILVYPVITMSADGHGGSTKNLLGAKPDPKLVELFSNQLQVNGKTPPAFLAHAEDDKLVPLSNSRLFHEAMVKHNVPSRLLVLPSGGHGLNGYKGPMWDRWQTDSLEWLRELKFLPAK